MRDGVTENLPASVIAVIFYSIAYFLFWISPKDDTSAGRAITAMYHMYRVIHLSKRGCDCWVLLQLEELADEVLFCQTKRLQLTQDLLENLQPKHIVSLTRVSIFSVQTACVHQCDLIKLGPVSHIQVRRRHIAHVQQ